MIKLDIIGLVAPAGTGKSTVARSLRRLKGYQVMAFAGPIKDMIAALGIPRAALNNAEDKDRPLAFLLGEGTPITPRYLMQTLGTEWGRQLVDTSLWVKLADYSIQFLRQQREELVRQAAAELAVVREKAEQFQAGSIEGPVTAEGRPMTIDEILGEVDRITTHVESSKTLRLVFDDVRFPEELALIENLGGRVYRLLRDGVHYGNSHESEGAILDSSCIPVTLYDDLKVDERGLYEEGEALDILLDALTAKQVPTNDAFTAVEEQPDGGEAVDEGVEA